MTPDTLTQSGVPHDQGRHQPMPRAFIDRKRGRRRGGRKRGRVEEEEEEKE